MALLFASVLAQYLWTQLVTLVRRQARQLTLEAEQHSSTGYVAPASTSYSSTASSPSFVHQPLILIIIVIQPNYFFNFLNYGSSSYYSAPESSTKLLYCAKRFFNAFCFKNNRFNSILDPNGLGFLRSEFRLYYQLFN